MQTTSIMLSNISRFVHINIQTSASISLIDHNLFFPPFVNLSPKDIISKSVYVFKQLSLAFIAYLCSGIES